MEKKTRSKSKSKSVNKENGEKRHGLKSKLKKAFPPKSFRSLSNPRLISNSNKNVSETDGKSLKHVSNNSSPTNSIDGRSLFLTMTQSNISNESHEEIELSSIRNSNNSIHAFINQGTDNKITFCDVCNQEMIPFGSVIACKYCQVVCHEKCCKKIKLPCQNNRLSTNFEQLKLNIEPNQQNNDSEVKLRKKAINSEHSPNESDYYTCQSNFQCGTDNTRACFSFFSYRVESMNCRDSLMSIASTSSMASQVSYDFTTLDHDSIKLFDIHVKPINQRATTLIENASNDCINIDSRSETSLITSDKSSTDCLCRPSFIYQEGQQDIMKIDWTIDDLAKRSQLFNQNNFGLTSEVKYGHGEGYILGTVRVYINLLRPIQMELPNRPSSIFDVITDKETDETPDSNLTVESFWMPRGTSKRFYAHHFTSAADVINGLLKKFHIKANPKKFGLYEHSINGERSVTVRKLFDIECPLATLLMWSEDGTDRINETMVIKRLVLQENETGDIEWTGFSEPELKNFLIILNREEIEHKNKIQLKYSILKNEIQRLQKLICTEIVTC